MAVVPHFNGSDYITFKVGPDLYITVSHPLIDDNGNYTNLMNKVLLFGSGEIYENYFDVRMVQHTLHGYGPRVAELTDQGWTSPYLDLEMLGYAQQYSFCDIIIGDGITHLGTLSTETSSNPLAGFHTGSVEEYEQYEDYEKWNGRKIKEEYCCLFASKDLEYIGRHINIGYYFPGLVHIQFSEGSKLKEINDIGYYYASENRQLLETINIPPTCKIGGDGFCNCTKLYYINNTNSFGGFLESTQGFDGCDSMIEFTLPDSESGYFAYYGVYASSHDPHYDPATYPQIPTVIRGNSSGVDSYDWYLLGREVTIIDSTILRLGHMGSIVPINGYPNGLLPFRHNGQIYYMRECQNGDPNQSPLVIKHKGSLHYISK